MIESRQELERPGALRRAVAELGSLAAAGGGERDGAAALAGLGALGSPPVLDLLFRVALRSALRRGPGGAGETGSPGELLALAGRAAGAGLLPVSTALGLRGDLAGLEGELRESGAWAPEAPFWWSPVPPPGPLEELRRELAGPGGPALPPPEELAAALAPPAERRGGGAGWIAWPEALPGALLARVAAELEAAGGEVSGLTPGGVGRTDRRSARRSDAVRYLDGLEPEHLARAPALALLTQHLLEDLEPALRRALPARSLFAPQTAMLARYPAPSPGFDAHLDNPGGPEDNRRALTFVLYLNAAGGACRGGELALWAAGASTGEEPAARVPAVGGSAILFDARTTPHAVRPLAPGPDRWTLVVWLSERAQRPDRPLLPVPAITPDQALLPVEDPSVAAGTVILRRVEPGGRPARLAVRRVGEEGRVPRVGVVATVRDAGPGLEAWCRHHLALGADRLLVVLDGSEDREAEAAGHDLASRLGAAAGERVTVWSGEDARRRWEDLPPVEELAGLRRRAEGGAAAWAVAARQALNASAALAAVRGDLDWLLHLDGDELFHLEGAGRGGATLAEHFAAVEAEGWTRVRYVNHELLVPFPEPARPGAPPRFKRNPAVAAARLGPEGWARLARLLSMEQGDRRPWFRAYWNGKSAVKVAAGRFAPGVHGWAVAGGGEEPLLAGPSVLHLHLPDAAAFRRKYSGLAGAPDDPGRPFPPSPLERVACSLIRELRRSGAPAAEIAARLDELYRAVTAFGPEEVELLEEADLLFTPRLEHLPVPPVPAGAAPQPEDGAGGGTPWMAELDGDADRRRAEAAERAPLRALPPGAAGADGRPALAVCVLGGGTAGYLAALALRAKRPRVRVTLVQSSDLPPIGVGEATTPLMPQFLHVDLGLPAADLFREVRPTLKLGIRFLWGAPEAPNGGGFPYPFGPVRPLEGAVWDGHLGRCSLRAALMAAGALPVEASAAGGAWRAAFGTEVAYHLDNRRLAAFLQRQAVARGVEVVDARVVEVETRTGGEGGPEVAALVAEDGRRFSADLYLDCSGFRSLLVGEALGSPWVGYEGSLFTDRAVVAAARRSGPLPPFTEARTLPAGWSWSIPQEGEDHVGYVYASAFATPEAAAEELRRAHPASAGAGPRELSFRPGRRAQFWRGNAVALGNAYGFVEPLESTALHLLIRQIGLLLQALPERAGGGAGALAPRVNARVAAFWDYVAWFLALHFRFNRRLDTPFWRACRGEVDVSAHGELLELFRERGPLSYDPAARALFDYPDPLWGPEGIDTILLGLGVEARLPRPAVTREAWQDQTALYDRIAARSLPQGEVLRTLDDHPEVLEALEEAFRRRGPAFP